MPYNSISVTDFFSSYAPEEEGKIVMLGNVCSELFYVWKEGRTKHSHISVVECCNNYIPSCMKLAVLPMLQLLWYMYLPIFGDFEQMYLQAF